MRRHAWLAFASTRVALIVLGYFVLTAFPPNPVESWQGIVFPDNKWIDGWVRWDSMWYEAIVNNTPRFLPSGHSSANFFPLYSWASWLVSLPLRVMLDHERAFYVGGLLVSAVSFLLALIAVERLAARLAGADVAVRTVWLIAVFPFSFFLTAVYADALYFCLCAWSLTCAYERRWPLACALAAMASMTRIPGIALFPALGLEYLRQHDFRLDSLRKAPLYIAILAAGPLVIGGYYYWRYGDPIAFLHARQLGWNRAVGVAGWMRDFGYFFESPIFPCSGVAECIKEFAPTRTLIGAIYLALLPITIGFTVMTARALGIGLTTWTLLSIAMSLPNGFDGVGRFTAVLFPFFIAVAMRLRNTTLFAAVCLACVPFLLLFFAQFARWRQVL